MDLVTGAGGFIGSHLVEALVRHGRRVRALVQYNSRNDWGRLELLDRKLLAEVEVVAGDIRDTKSLAQTVAGCDTVYHLAALIAIPYSYRAPASYVQTNVHGTLNVMQVALDAGVTKVVHTSTSEVYGTAEYVPIDEKHPLKGQSPYSASKIGADMVAESYFRSFELPVAIVRPFNTYGPRQSARAIIPTIITQILHDAPLKLGSLSPTRDLTYVADTVEGFLRIAASAECVGKVTNVGSGSEISVGKLAELIMNCMGVIKPIIADPQRTRPQRSEVERLLCDSRQAQARVKWAPRYTLRDGLNETIAWVKQNQGLFKFGMYSV